MPYRSAPQHDELLERIRQRSPHAHSLATAYEIAALEACIGRALPPLLVRLYTEVGNGGFGPPYGLLPLAEIGNLWELWTDAGDEPGFAVWAYPPNYLLVVDSGCAMYYCIDLADPDLQVFMFEPGGFVADNEELDDEEDSLEPTTTDQFMEAVFERQRPFVQWLEAWLDERT